MDFGWLKTVLPNCWKFWRSVGAMGFAGSARAHGRSLGQLDPVNSRPTGTGMAEYDCCFGTAGVGIHVAISSAAGWTSDRMTPQSRLLAPSLTPRQTSPLQPPKLPRHLLIIRHPFRHPLLLFSFPPHHDRHHSPSNSLPQPPPHRRHQLLNRSLITSHRSKNSSTNLSPLANHLPSADASYSG
ncbi:hypothetical protein Pan216_07690 [Planctomycetes bacterium Pan216]|uniref:Uncharacterized protein n=1 Tax=Kolteria novifilia TaxID=2527975 RepID=A0A518AYY0_9BACT|nr:hypothetical protein Pan216_07690 [Planctomycetes bacterium Pan216]